MKISNTEMDPSETPISIPVVIGGRLNDINTRAARDFAKRFKSVDKEKWYIYPNSLAVCFEKNKIDFTVFYDQLGNWRFTQLTYNKEKFPSAVTKRINHFFPDCTIFGVEEVLSDLEFAVYFIHIQSSSGESEVKNLKLYDGEIYELECRNGKWGIKKTLK